MNKIMWESFKEWWNAFTNNPITISITTVVTTGILILVILSKTSIGKKALRGLSEGYQKLTDKFHALIRGYELFKKETIEELEHYKEENQVLKDETENKVSAIYIQYEYFKNDVYKVLEKIPNKHVQDALSDLKATTSQKESEIKTLLGESYEKINTQLSDTFNSKIQYLESENERLKGELTEIKEILVNLKNKAMEVSNEEEIKQIIDDDIEEDEEDGGRNEESNSTI